MFERIDALVITHGFEFLAWDDCYSQGVMGSSRAVGWLESYRAPTCLARVTSR